LEELLQRTHVHGLAVDRGDPERLLVATHHGLYVAGPDGRLEQVSPRQDDLMGFSAHPTESDVLYPPSARAISGSAPARMGTISTMVTSTPARAKSWPSSQPI
jgi:hypothetical protein